MVTIQYIYGNTVESFRLSLASAEEYAKALKNKGINCQIIL